MQGHAPARSGPGTLADVILFRAPTQVRQPAKSAMQTRDVILSPIHALRVASGAKSFAGNPILGAPALNRRGLHVGRVRLAQDLAERRRVSLAAPIPAGQREAFARDGFVSVPDFLPRATFEGVLAELERADFERIDMRQGRTITRRALIDHESLRGRPHLEAAKNDARLRDLIRYVASYGGEPLLTLQIVLAGAAGDADPQTMLHADTFHPTAKAWLFLRDVGEDDGPFQYVPGSHRMTPERYGWERRISENPDAIENVYARRGSFRVAADELPALGYGAPQAMTVRANTLVVADTHGFHSRVPSPHATTRIEIYGSLRRNPFMPVSLPHLAALPGIAGRTDKLAQRAYAWRQRLGGKGSPWVSIGRGRVDEWPSDLPR